MTKKFLTAISSGITANILVAPAIKLLDIGVTSWTNREMKSPTRFDKMAQDLVRRLTQLKGVLLELAPSTPVSQEALETLNDAVAEAQETLNRFKKGNFAARSAKLQLLHVSHFEHVHRRLDSAINDLALANSVSAQLGWDPEEHKKQLGEIQASLQENLEMSQDIKSDTQKTLAMVTALLAQSQGAAKPEWRAIERSEVKMGRRIGSGGFGAVFQARWNGTVVAVKAMHAAEMDQAGKEVFLNEARIMAKIRHPNVVSLYGVIDDDEGCALVMEYVDGGSLYDLLHNKCIDVPHDASLLLGLELAKALECVHSEGVVHRDVKSANVLVTRQWQIKMCDFGLSKVKNTEALLRSRVGTDAWMAPEVHAEFGHGPTADVYSWAMVMTELFNGVKPYDGVSDIKTAIAALNTRPPLPDDLPASVKELMQSSWTRSPADRPSMADVRSRLIEILGDDADESVLSCIPSSTYRAWSEGDAERPLSASSTRTDASSVASPSASEVAVPMFVHTVESADKVGNAPPPSVHSPGAEESSAEIYNSALVDGLVATGCWSKEGATQQLSQGDYSLDTFTRLLAAPGDLGSMLDPPPSYQSTRKGRSPSRSPSRPQSPVYLPADTQKWLREHKLNDDGSGFTPAGDTSLHVAIAEPDADEGLQYLKHLLASGNVVIDGVNSASISPLIAACLAGRAAMVTELMMDGASPTATNPQGSGPLLAAVNIDSVETARALIQSCTLAQLPQTVESANKWGNTPLIRAAAKGSKEMVELLLREGRAQVSAANKDGWSAAHAAAVHGHSEVVAVLSAQGLEGVVGVPTTTDGWTVLHCAARSGSVETVHAVLRGLRGGPRSVLASILELQNTAGDKASELAKDDGHKEIAKLLSSAKACHNIANSSPV